MVSEMNDEFYCNCEPSSATSAPSHRTDNTILKPINFDSFAAGICKNDVLECVFGAGATLCENNMDNEIDTGVFDFLPKKFRGSLGLGDLVHVSHYQHDHSLFFFVFF